MNPSAKGRHHPLELPTEISVREALRKSWAWRLFCDCDCVCVGVSRPPVNLEGYTVFCATKEDLPFG